MSSTAAAAKSAVHSASATGYAGAHATNYQATRPGYPDEIADYVLQHTLLSSNNTPPSTKQRILDVGAGTGKWTVTLEAALKRHQIQYELLAADPVPSMAEIFAQQLPHIPIHQQAASELQFGDASFDLLTAATAFHWFCDPASVRGLHRVLKPGACFAILGYDVKIDECWTQAMNDLTMKYYPIDTPLPSHGHWRRALDEAAQQRLLEPVAHAMFKDAAGDAHGSCGVCQSLLECKCHRCAAGRGEKEVFGGFQRHHRWRREAGKQDGVGGEE